MDPDVLRDDMVDGLAHDSKGVLDSERVGAAMRSVPRREFVPEGDAYLDRAHEYRGTRTLAPSTVARLIEALDARPDDSVLVVGAGVGYTAAVLAEIVGPERVQAVDIDRTLVYDARDNLRRAGYESALVDCRDGADGYPEYAPFDRILVEAAAVDPPPALLDQLASDGRLVMPRGTSRSQSLIAVTGDDGSTPEAGAGIDDPSGPGEYAVERHGPVAFDPLLVEGEQTTTIERNRTVREDRQYAERDARGRRGWERDWIDWE
ncbi:protein-L-isoaspartate O-methyltransferase [Halobacteriales archaeon SW_7_68_16]|nr:MAG: protein-L-isoaspartate O-methyltransferase [Halobacteriales archaeon SW_7_68_16]